MGSMEEQNTEGTSSQPEVGAPGQPVPENANPNMKWYIIHTYSGFEKKVKESLESRIVAFGLQEKIGKVLIPTEPVTEIRGGKKYTVERMFYPGYVLVQMDLTGFRSQGEGDNVWHVVKSTPRVTGFVGTANDPTPLSEDEVGSFARSEEHTSELQSRQYLVCRLLLEKKKRR